MNPYMNMWGPPGGGYGWPPMVDPLEQIRNTMKWLKELEESYKKKDDGKKPPEGFKLTSFEVFVVMTLLSPFIGHLMEYLINMAKTIN